MTTLVIANSSGYGMRGSNPNGDYTSGSAPTPPGSLIATPLSSTRVGLTWADLSNDETGFEIERSFDGVSGWLLIDTVPSSITAYTNQGLTPSTAYYYRVRAVNGMGNSAYTAISGATTDAAGSLEAAILANYNFLPQDAEGYSILTPSADSRLIYVDAADGNDGTATNYTLSTLPNINDWESPGAVKAYQDIEIAVLQMRQDYPDYLLLKRDGVFPVSNYVRIYSGRNIDERSVVTAYGTGERPSLNPSGDFEALRIWNFGTFIAIKSVAVHPTFRDPNHVDFAGWGFTAGNNAIQIWNSSNHPQKHGILIEDLHANYCNTAISASSNFGPNTLAGYDLIFRRNIIENSYSEEGHSQGLKSYRYSALIEDCVFDHNGWLIRSFDGTKSQGQGTIYNHNIYCGESGYDYLMRNNISARTSSIGIKMTSNPKAGVNEVYLTDMLIDNNLIIDAELALSLGGNDDYEDGPRWSNIEVTNNVLTKLGESRPTNRNLAWGIELDDWQSGTVTGNLLHDYGSDIITNTIPFQVKGACTDILIDSNICWNIGITTGEDNHPTGLRVNEGGDVGFVNTGVVISNNHFQCPDKQSLVLDTWEAQPGAVYTDNKYYSARDPNEWFRLSRLGEGDTYHDYAGWQGEPEITDTGGILLETVWVDDTRTIETYMASLGQTPTLEAFLAKAKEMRPGNWDPAYTATAFNDYMRAGFTEV